MKLTEGGIMKVGGMNVGDTKAGSRAQSRGRADSLSSLVHRLEQVIDAEWTLLEPNLTLRQAELLQAVQDSEGQNQTYLVDRTGIDRSTLADIVRRLQKRGYVQRRRTKEDARAYAVKLTDEGHKVLQGVRQKLRTLKEITMGSMSRQERDAFVEAIEGMVRAHEGRQRR